MPSGALAHGELPDGSGGPHVFVEDINIMVLAEHDRHHLERALRTRPGDPITVSDGAGRWQPCRFGSNIEPDGEVVVTATQAQPLTLGFALTKGTKPELVVQKATELGIDYIIPFLADRSVARWDDSKALKQGDRLVKIAREASMQSRRVWLPTVTPLRAFAEFSPPAVLAHRGGGPLRSSHHTVLIGPEGGWGDSERGALEQVHLTPTVLRAETAAIAAATLMTHLREQRRAPH